MTKKERVNLFLNKAKKDIKTARSLNIEDPDFQEAIVFHCQQAIEKYLKAFLIKNNVEYAKIHDLEFLIQEAMKIDKTFEKFIEIAELFNEYAVEIRYENIPLSKEDTLNSLDKITEFENFISVKFVK
ncbi:MAG: HEPN domain-containing protein [Candidatus Margulisbacteria bacterium]|nr:HEPN domain-containing protein [Candidatus Margulisiibacteriota bacterium]